MVKVEIVMDGAHWELNILKREDATDDEFKIAKAVEKYILLVWEKLNKEYGGTLTKIG